MCSQSAPVGLWPTLKIITPNQMAIHPMARDLLLLCSMITLILGLAVIGLLVYLLEHYVPMSPPFTTAIRVVVVVCIVIYLVRLFGLDLPVPRVR